MKIAGLYIPIRILKAQKVFNLTNEKREFLINIIFNTINNKKLPENIMFKKRYPEVFLVLFECNFYFRRNSNASSDSDQKEDPDVRPPKFISILTKRSYMFHRSVQISPLLKVIFVT